MKAPPTATERDLDTAIRELRKIWEREAEVISLIVRSLNRDYWALRGRLMKRDPMKRYWGGLYLAVQQIPTTNTLLPSWGLYWRKGKRKQKLELEVEQEQKQEKGGITSVEPSQDIVKKTAFPDNNHVPMGTKTRDSHYPKRALRKALKGCHRWEWELTYLFETHAAVLRSTFHRQHRLAELILKYPGAIKELPSLNTTKVENELAAYIKNPVAAE